MVKACFINLVFTTFVWLNFSSFLLRFKFFNFIFNFTLGALYLHPQSEKMNNSFYINGLLSKRGILSNLLTPKRRLLRYSQDLHGGTWQENERLWN